MNPEAKKTSLDAWHKSHGARMFEFGGWEMPLNYKTGIVEEHLAIRRFGGLFDVSHLGRFLLTGEGALPFLQYVLANNAAALDPGQAQYTMLPNQAGGAIDDAYLYRLEDGAPSLKSEYLLVVNAANKEKDWDWFMDHRKRFNDLILEDKTDDIGMLALQGPEAKRVLEKILLEDHSKLPDPWRNRLRICELEGEHVTITISRTGYTGEDGFEVYCAPVRAEAVWTQIMDAGKPLGLEPAGLAARNTLRLEAKMLLYGNDMDETTTVLEADLGWICKLHKGEFIGRDVLLRQRESGLSRILVGFEMVDRGIARDHYPVEIDGRSVGVVTSGSPAPWLKKNIGLTYLPADRMALGTEFNVLIREKPVKAHVVPTPFYRKPPSR